MWHPNLTRLSRSRAAISPLLRTLHSTSTRPYSLRSHKIQALVEERKLARDNDRELILKVMGTLPSPREARQFLSKFSPPAPVVASATASDGSQRPTDFVDSLLWSTDHLALIKLEGPFESENLIAVADTLVQLQRLGVLSIVMLDNQSWWQNQDSLASSSIESPLESTLVETRQRMIKDMTEIVQQIEDAGGKARPVAQDIFEENAPGDIVVRPGLASLRSCLRHRHIPVMIPMATENSCWKPISSNLALTALARYMGESAKDDHYSRSNDIHVEISQGGPIVPLRLIVINTIGGIPLSRTSGFKGPTHCFVNLKDEFTTILDDLDNMEQISDSAVELYRSDLKMIKDSLDHLPPTCSAIITSSPSLTLITNLITDKPLFSSTLRSQDPKEMLATTVLRNGLDIFTFRSSLDGLDLKQLTGLLESSFGKPLSSDAFYDRIKDRMRTVILAGKDYMGAAVVTKEGGYKGANGQLLTTVAYLDKFSVAPKSQGIGVADILWKKLQDEFPDLVWRSRTDNPVNKWYFDRADGSIQIPGTNWTVFWYGSKGLHLIRDYIEISRDIPASFYALKPKAF
ncbi:Amino-acid acetyltransferase, mitochondrial [Lunasporangiospora selenospora]|uniref:Amino-acid acetyltransferase, mitochondrial n=1 Tax=Lunasporangiospora selenospora TaxID=979761 RepID=A0A9P6KGE8_9FUNG|nr:Amino-acid acetyltransferase, mitochondrial [Lunasporangiospora selenospora]